jgi:hypothetical protein
VNAEPDIAGFYVTGGTMPPYANSYVIRAADEELLRALERREYCYVLTTRQMGKSSLVARTELQLAGSGVRSVQITLETIRESGATPSADQFLYSVANRIHKELGFTGLFAVWWREREPLSPTERFHEYLTEFLLENYESPIVVFMDEIDSTIGLPFADDFYATIRACYNGRASKPDLQRLTFVLLGVATPAQLIADPARTPFNIGHGIALDDFTMAEAESLAQGLPGPQADQRALLERVLHWTGGHPYLTQTLCRVLADRGAGDTDSRLSTGAVDEEVERLFLRPGAAREEANLKFVGGRLTQGTADLREVLHAYRRILQGKIVEDEPGSSIHASLKLAGVVRVDPDRRLRVRNEIYARVFDHHWVRRELARSRPRLTAGSTAASQKGAQWADFFYAMKDLDVIVANLEREESSPISAQAQARRMRLAAQRAELQRSVESLRSSARPDKRLTEQDRLILRVTRLFGECDLLAPSDYVADVWRHIDRWRASDRYRQAMQAAGRHRFAERIVAELAAQHLPPQFFYLALKESNFDPLASGPLTEFGTRKGMWGLLPETARGYGLDLGPPVTPAGPDSLDQRHHWQLATAAAVRYLKDVYATDAQGSGLLVMALYRWDSRTGDLVRKMGASPRRRNFWQLLEHGPQLPAETRDYVLSIVAAAVIGESPRLFGFEFDNPLS